jgi:hypothetical protein
MSNKRSLVNEHFFSDWVYLTALGLAGFAAFSNLNSSYFLYGNADFNTNELVSASIDALLQTYLVFGVLVLILGLSRRVRSEVPLLEPEKGDNNRLVKIHLTVLVVAGVALFAAYTNGANRNLAEDSKSTVLEADGFSPIARTCRAQGSDELCVSGLQTDTSASFNFELTYSTPRTVNGYEVAKSTWDVSVDCETQSVTTGNVKFLDVNFLDVVFDAESMLAAEAGLQETYGNSLLLSQCG